MTYCNNIDTSCSLVKQNYLNYTLKSNLKTHLRVSSVKYEMGLYCSKCKRQFKISLLKSVIFFLTTEIIF